MVLTRDEEDMLTKLTGAEEMSVREMFDEFLKKATKRKKVSDLKEGDKVVFRGAGLGGSFPDDLYAYVGNTFDDGSAVFYSAGMYAGPWKESFTRCFFSSDDKHDIPDYGYAYVCAHLSVLLKADAVWIPDFKDFNNPVARKALISAAGACSSFGPSYDGAWLGTPGDSNGAYGVDSDGYVGSGGRSYSFVVAPAFTIGKESLESLFESGKAEVVDDEDDD